MRGRPSLSNAEFVERVRALGNDIKPLEKYKSSRKDKIKFKHLTCGTIWSTMPSAIMRGKGCPVCGRLQGAKKQALAHTEFSKRLKTSLPHITLVDNYTGLNNPIRFKDKLSGHIWKDFPRNVLRKQQCRNNKNILKFSSVVNSYVRGYEPQAIEYIVNKGLAKANDLEVTGVPSVKYKHKGKIRTYRPDIFVVSQNRLVEVKSVATLGLLRDYYYKNGRTLLSELKAKRLGCLKAGFKFTLLLMTREGVRLNLPADWHKLSVAEICHALGLTTIRENE